MSKVFDTHCHYNLENYTANWQEQWEKAQASGVAKSLVVGIDFATSALACSLAAGDKNLYAAIGSHPELYVVTTERTLDSVEQDVETDIEEIRLIHDKKNVKAIGEVGLDYFRLERDDTASRYGQQLGLKAHISYANEVELPLILHVRDQAEEAYWDVLSILKKYKKNDLPFILHCVSGPEKYVLEALEMGAYVSVAGNVTYKNADHIRSLAALVPTDKLLLETDAPFLPPQQFRGKPCEPWMISLTAEYLETELKRDLDEVYNNSLVVFGVQ